MTQPKGSSTNRSRTYQTPLNNEIDAPDCWHSHTSNTTRGGMCYTHCEDCGWNWATLEEDLVPTPENLDEEPDAGD